MTTEAGGGVPPELRERLAAMFGRVGGLATNEPMSYEERADLILAEIAAAGYVLVAEERMDRLRRWSKCWIGYAEMQGAGIVTIGPVLPGDLDRPGGAE